MSTPFSVVARKLLLAGVAIALLSINAAPSHAQYFGDYPGGGLQSYHQHYGYYGLGSYGVGSYGLGRYGVGSYGMDSPGLAAGYLPGSYVPSGFGYNSYGFSGTGFGYGWGLPSYGLGLGYTSYYAGYGHRGVGRYYSSSYLGTGYLGASYLGGGYWGSGYRYGYNPLAAPLDVAWPAAALAPQVPVVYPQLPAAAVQTDVPTEIILGLPEDQRAGKHTTEDDPNLAPGMILPDGSKVLSVDPIQ